MRVKQEVQELFPTPLWVVDLQRGGCRGLNAKLKAEIERHDRAAAEDPGRQQLADAAGPAHTPAFAEFTKLVEIAARGVAPLPAGRAVSDG